MGAYGNVLLSDDDIGKLKSEFPSDWRSRIETLSEYIACSGKRYENHLAVIRRWARIDAEKERAAKPAKSVENRYAYSEEDVL